MGFAAHENQVFGEPGPLSVLFLHTNPKDWKVEPFLDAFDSDGHPVPIGGFDFNCVERVQANLTGSCTCTLPSISTIPAIFTG
jgi:hypothetical protein